MMASISLRRYVGCSWHVTQAVRTCHYTGEPASLLEVLRIIGHGKTSDYDASSNIGVLMKSPQKGTFSVNIAIGRADGKPLATIGAQRI